MKAFFGITTLLVVQCSLFCQTAAAPIPTKWLRDGQLVVPEFNFSINSPNLGSRWSYKDDFPRVDGSAVTAFFVDVDPKTRYALLVMDRSGEMHSPTAKQFMEGVQESLPKDWQLRDPQIEPTDIPVKNSMKFRATCRLPNNSTLYTYLYVVPGKQTYEIVTYSADPTEPLPFSRFVASFALIATSANSPQPNMSGVLLLWALWGAVIDWRYIRRGGMRPSRNDKIGVLAALGFCTVVMALLGIRGASGESLGSMAGLCITLIFSLWEGARWRIRRRAPLPELKAEAIGT